MALANPTKTAGAFFRKSLRQLSRRVGFPNLLPARRVFKLVGTGESQTGSRKNPAALVSATKATCASVNQLHWTRPATPAEPHGAAYSAKVGGRGCESRRCRVHFQIRQVGRVGNCSQGSAGGGCHQRTRCRVVIAQAWEHKQSEQRRPSRCEAGILRGSARRVFCALTHVENWEAEASAVSRVQFPPLALRPSGRKPGQLPRADPRRVTRGDLHWRNHAPSQ